MTEEKSSKGNLFAPLKALGLNSSKVPLTVNQTFKKDHNVLSAIGDLLPEEITCMASTKTVIFCGTEKRIYSIKRAKHINQQYEAESCANWRCIVPLEVDGMICAVAGNQNKLVFFDVVSGEIFRSVPFPAGEFDICGVLQPRGYIGKLVIVARDGKMWLYKYRTNETIFQYELDCDVTIVVDSPQQHVIAVGCADGSVVLHNIQYDRHVVTIEQDMGAVRSIAFRTDIDDRPMAIIGTEHGHVVLFDLANRRNAGQSRHCHDAAVVSLYCVDGQPLLLSSGEDNSIKVWNYDRPDGTPLLIRFRCGHSMPPHCIEFWPSGRFSTEIVSAADDSRVHVFSTIEPRQNYPMGRAYQRGHGSRREDRVTRQQYVMSHPVDLSLCALRDGYWDSMAMCHDASRQVTTWSVSRRCRGKHLLDAAVFMANEYLYSRVAANCCAISLCGNFIIVGYSSGHAVKYNMQSGEERGTIMAHDSASIRGLQCGLSNVLPVFVTAAQDSVRMWDFMSMLLLNQLSLDSCVQLLRSHPDMTMIAALTYDGTAVLVELAGLTKFRQIRVALHGPPVDVAFFHHEQLAVVADGNALRTFDYVNAVCVDCFVTQRPIRAVSVSPNDALLATAHDHDVGIYLWARRPTAPLTVLPNWHVDDDRTAFMTLPLVHTDADDDQSDGDELPLEGVAPIVDGGMVQLCQLSSNYLATVMRLDDLMKRRQTDTKGFVADEFFLPQIVETVRGIAWNDSIDKPIDKVDSRKRRADELDQYSDLQSGQELAQLLIGAQTDEQCDRVMQLLTGLTEASVDYEIRLLDPALNVDGLGPMMGLLRVFRNQLVRQRNVDQCGVLLWVLLRHNRDALCDESDNDEDDREDDVEVADTKLECRNVLIHTDKVLRSSTAAIMDQFRQINSLVDFVCNGVV